MEELVSQGGICKGKYHAGVAYCMGRTMFPASTAYLMFKRLTSSSSSKVLSSAFYTGDVVACLGDEFKLVFTSDAQGNLTRSGRSIFTEEEFLNAFQGYRLPPHSYESLVGEEIVSFSCKDLLDSHRYERLWRLASRCPHEVPARFAEDPQLLEIYRARFGAQKGSMQIDSPKRRDPFNTCIRLGALAVNAPCPYSDSRLHLDLSIINRNTRLLPVSRDLFSTSRVLSHGSARV